MRQWVGLCKRAPGVTGCGGGCAPSHAKCGILKDLDKEKNRRIPQTNPKSLCNVHQVHLIPFPLIFPHFTYNWASPPSRTAGAARHIYIYVRTSVYGVNIPP